MVLLHPVIKWAQRKSTIIIQLEISDIEKEKVQLETDKIYFSCYSQGKDYEFKVELFAPVVQQESKWNKTGFHMVFLLAKKDKDQPYWPRLSKEAVKSQYIQCDWAKWIDQDDEEGQGHKGMQGFNPDDMQNFNDSDDEEEVPLKQAQPKVQVPEVHTEPKTEVLQTE